MVVSSLPETPRTEDAGSDDPLGASGSPHGWLVVASLGVLCVPLVVALVAFRRHTWTPVLDLAMTELRVRDVGGRHTPLIGLPGRIFGTNGEQGSHPGPASFYALAPVYRALGSSAWALQVATFVIHAVGMGAALLIAGRRGGRGLVLVVAVALAALTAGYGAGTLTEPWNPYLPLLWWLVVLLAVWSVLCDDLAMLPVAVVAASFCAQTHVPYLGLTLGMGALATAAVVLRWRRVPTDRRATRRWVGLALGLGVLLWLPPTLDEVRHEPGNYTLLVENFSNPEEEMVGLSKGGELGLRYLDLAHLVRGDVTDPGWLVTDARGNLPSSWRGLALLVAWAGAALVALRRPRDAALLRLHAVVAAGIVLMIVAISRIFGGFWYYLVLWGWSIGILALVASVWTVVHVAGEGLTGLRRARLGRGALAALAVAGVLCVGRFGVAAWDGEHSDPTVAAELAAVVDDVAQGLDADLGLATGQDGRYLVTWDDAFHIGSQGYGLASELERRGFDIAVEPSREVPMTAHRVLGGAGATARVHLAVGEHAYRWQGVEGAVELAFIDPRTESEALEQDQLRREVLAELRDRGLDDLVPKVDENLFGAAIDDRVPASTQRKMGRMLELGAPLAVFVVPVDATAT